MQGKEKDGDAKDEKKEEKKEEKKDEKKEEKTVDKNHADSFDSHGKGWETEGEGTISGHDIDVGGMGDLMRLDKRQRSHYRSSARDMDRKYCPGGKCDYADDRVREDRDGKYVEDDAANY
jgi:hypothetical protein